MFRFTQFFFAVVIVLAIYIEYINSHPGIGDFIGGAIETGKEFVEGAVDTGEEIFDNIRDGIRHVAQLPRNYTVDALKFGGRALTGAAEIIEPQ